MDRVSSEFQRETAEPADALKFRKAGCSVGGLSEGIVEKGAMFSLRELFANRVFVRVVSDQLKLIGRKAPELKNANQTIVANLLTLFAALRPPDPVWNGKLQRTKPVDFGTARRAFFATFAAQLPDEAL